MGIRFAHWLADRRRGNSAWGLLRNTYRGAGISLTIFWLASITSHHHNLKLTSCKYIPPTVRGHYFELQDAQRLPQVLRLHRCRQQDLRFLRCCMFSYGQEYFVTQQRANLFDSHAQTKSPHPSQPTRNTTTIHNGSHSLGTMIRTKL